jgi:hypothetical protein
LLLNAKDDWIRTNLQNADERVTSLIDLLQKKKAAYEGSKTVENKEELKRVQGERSSCLVFKNIHFFIFYNCIIGIKLNPW